MRSDKSRRRFVFLCVAPATILFFLFMILPTLNVFRMSLYERGAYSPNETFVGLKNFQHLLKDAQFIRSMQNMILLVVVVTIVTFAFALVFAAILTREKIKGQNFFRVIFYIPNILSVVVISGIFRSIYKPENGMLNSIIGLFRDMTDPIPLEGRKAGHPLHHPPPWSGRPWAITWSCIWLPCPRCPPACTRAPIWTVRAA